MPEKTPARIGLSERTIEETPVRYLPRDFVETPEGLLFAVVDRSTAGETIPCFLRYCRSTDGGFRKLGTGAANDLLRREYPRYLFRCEKRDAALHGVCPQELARHLRPRDRLQGLLDPSYPADSFEARTARLARALLSEGVGLDSLGITGSVLVGSHRAGSDIDLVLYDAAAFRAAREAVSRLTGQGVLTLLDERAWQDAYSRRGCALTYEEFRWHEERKRNKGVFEGTKFDLSLVVDDAEDVPRAWRKLGPVKMSTRVTGDEMAFDYPARLQIEDERIGEVVSFTATYSGQARVGERIEVCGLLEQTTDGTRRIVVGTDREAAGQYVKVMR